MGDGPIELAAAPLEVNDRAGQRASDALDQLDARDNLLAEFVERFGLRFDNQVIRPGDFFTTHDAAQDADGFAHRR